MRSSRDANAYQNCRRSIVLKAVTFDLWNTLITERPEGSRHTSAERIGRIDAILREERIVRDTDAIVRAYGTVGERLGAIWATLRDIGAREQVEMMLEILQVEKQDRPGSLVERLIDAYTLPILTELPVPLDRVTEVLSILESRGLPLAVICNTGRTPGKILRIILDRLGIAKHLSVQTFSDELGLRKPRPEIFEHTLKALGVRPSEALHVGDMLAADIVGASSIGMRAVHLCHPRGADPYPSGGETISSLYELLTLIPENITTGASRL
jgi:putative hydrolase of the HAD superfamily